MPHAHYKFNSSPISTNGSLPPDAYASAIGTSSVRRRIGSSDDHGWLIDPWGEAEQPKASTSTITMRPGSGLRPRSKSRSSNTHVNGDSDGHHPLQGSSSGTSTAETRPGLRRILSSKDSKGALWGLSNGWVEECDDAGAAEGAPTPGSREMLVHKIQPKDSLAGVALRYGVSLAEIRRANKLWASDSIHLRSVLYIPLTANLKLGYGSDSNLIDLGTPSKESSVELSADVDDTSRSEPIPDSISDLGAPTIQHVPASELSFFPPPKVSPQKLGVHARTMPRGTVSPFASSPLLFSPGLSPYTQPLSASNTRPSTPPSKGNGTLSTIFSSLPLPETIQRLSLDSIAGGALTPRAGSSVSDISDQLLELSPLSARQKASARPKRTIRTQPMPGPVMTVPRRSIEGGDAVPVIEEDW